MPCRRTRVWQSIAVLPALPCGCRRRAQPWGRGQGPGWCRQRSGTARQGGSSHPGGARQRGGQPSKGPGTAGLAETEWLLFRGSRRAPVKPHVGIMFTAPALAQAEAATARTALRSRRPRAVQAAGPHAGSAQSKKAVFSPPWYFLRIVSFSRVSVHTHIDLLSETNFCNALGRLNLVFYKLIFCSNSEFKKQ